ncbi:MAG TPA: hypothetical protein VEA99_16225 [Gemmatimonadaceae bacterium]|nr:hypothetical protein [Gemmatimonadaceae bacterium]
MRLTVRFSGLFLFKKRWGELYVLAPRTGDEVTIGDTVFPMVPHVIVVQVYDAYDTGVGPVDPTKFRYVPLPNQHVGFDFGGSANAGSLSSKLARIKDLTGGDFIGDAYEESPDFLLSRFEVKSGRQCGSNEGGRFLVAYGRPQRLTCEVFWQFEDVPLDADGSFTITPRALRGVAAAPLRLKPVGGDLVLTILHVPPADLPTRGQREIPTRTPPDPLTPVSHLAALFQFYADHERLTLPLYLDGYHTKMGFPGVCGLGELGTRAVVGADPVTCVGGGG